MTASCPDCETALDQATGICPACRWDPILSARTAGQQLEPSPLVDRYRGAELESTWSVISPPPSAPVSRIRALVLVGLLGMAVLYVAVLAFLGAL